MRQFTLKVTEDELRAMIRHHASNVASNDTSSETSQRIHDLTKKLNRANDVELSNDPRPSNLNTHVVEGPNESNAEPSVAGWSNV